MKDLHGLCATLAPSTLTPQGSGPVTVNPDMRACAPSVIRTTAATGFPFRDSCADGVSVGGDLITVVGPPPLRVRSLSMTTSSVYVPGRTMIVSPGRAWFTAAWIEGTPDGTTMMPCASAGPVNPLPPIVATPSQRSLLAKA